MIPAEEKRSSAALIPYKKVGNEFHFFLQKRTNDAIRNPGNFGLFGGGLENGESPKEGLLREVKEELNFVPENYQLFTTFESAYIFVHVYILEVSDGFENTVKVSEGEYGKFLSLSDIKQESKLSDLTRLILKQLGEYLLDPEYRIK